MLLAILALPIVLVADIVYRTITTITPLSGK